MRCLSVFFVALGLVGSLSASDWPQFRGPGGSGVAADKGLPTTWSDNSNLAWKTEMPGAGTSSPIVVGNRVFLTCYSGYGVDKNDSSEMKDLKLHLLCMNRSDGNILWKRDIEPLLPEATGEGPYITLHGYASSTPICDGKHLYAFFGKTGVFAFDLDGKQLWQASVGKGKHGWGSGTSPILYKNLLIVNASIESDALVALDKSTGAEVWRAKGIHSSWNTPVLVTTPNGAVEVAVSTEPQMLGFDPDTGKQLWNAKTFNWYVCPSRVAHDGVLYGLQHSTCVAVKAGGRGDVTATHVLWKKNFGSVVTSLVYDDGRVYWVRDGMANCVGVKDGASIYKERLKGAAGDSLRLATVGRRQDLFRQPHGGGFCGTSRAAIPATRPQHARQERLQRQPRRQQRLTPVAARIAICTASASENEAHWSTIWMFFQPHFS